MKLIPLTKGMFTKVDDADFDFLNQFSWRASQNTTNFFARGWVNGKDISMHRLLMNFPSETVDHANLDQLDNQRLNLRAATQSQNNANKPVKSYSISGYKGVCFQRSRFKCNFPWVAYITVNYERYYCGAYQTPEEAATSYGLHALATFGEFARIS